MGTNTLTLRALDIPSVHRFGVGFDSMLDELMRLDAQQPNNYPPYNIVQINENEFVISLAVSGFGDDNLSVVKERNLLTVTGERIPAPDGLLYLHRGISNKNFTREFKLADYVEVSGCHLELGILSIYLKREVPEASKPKRIDISRG